LAACRGRLAGRDGERVQLALNSLRQCIAETGKSSAHRYKAWLRVERAHGREHPSVRFITTVFDSWELAKDAAGATVVGNVLARRLLGNSDPRQPKEMVAGLQEYAATGGALSLRQYVAWARRQMNAADRRLPYYVMDANTIIKTFGSWSGFVTAAGLNAELTARRRHGSHPAGPQEAYSRRASIPWVSEAASELGGPNMLVRAYDGWARRRSEAALAKGEILFIPRSQSLTVTFGGWPQALAAAGVIDELEAELRSERHKKIVGDRELAHWMARAICFEGAALEPADYMRWRKRRREGHQFKPLIPAAAAMSNRFGDWDEARWRGLAVIDEYGEARIRAMAPPLASEQPQGDGEQHQGNGERPHGHGAVDAGTRADLNLSGPPDPVCKPEERS